MTAVLRTLDVYLVMSQSDALVKRLRDTLGPPLKHEPEGADDIVHGQVVPQDLRRTKHVLFFHADLDTRATVQRKLVTAHLRYRLRPPGPAPKDLLKLRADGYHVEWAEGVLTSSGGMMVVLVEAELQLTKWERHRTPIPTPALQVGEAALKRCGEEYKSDAAAVGQLSKFRWVDREAGTLDAWLSYSYALEKKSEGLWATEESRCRKYLEQLV